MSENKELWFELELTYYSLKGFKNIVFKKYFLISFTNNILKI